MQNNSFNSHLIGTILFFQAISTRDKTTGKYLPLLDGNLNVTLNRIWCSQHSIKKVIITLPRKEFIDEIQLNELIKWCLFSFQHVEFEFIFLSCYGTNIDETRKNLLDSKNTLLTELIYCEVDCIVSEFPINLSLISTNLIYNYNWSKCDDNESNEQLNKFFKLEIELAKTYHTYLYSDVQLQYWKHNVDDCNPLYVHRSKAIFSKQYINKVSAYNIDKWITNEKNAKTKKQIDKIFGNDICIFYPSRIEDTRYQFDKICQIAINTNRTIIVTNPTKYDLNDYLLHIGLQPKIFDLSNETDKRGVYFYILSKLSPHIDVIYRFENDMHISLIEQVLLTKAMISSPNFTSKQIQSYIYTI